MRELIGSEAAIAKPVVKGELSLIGLDDSVSTDEVRCVLAEAGNCNPEEVKTGSIRMMSNRLGTVWAQCPLRAALKITEERHVKIGWTIARGVRPWLLSCTVVLRGVPSL